MGCWSLPHPALMIGHRPRDAVHQSRGLRRAARSFVRMTMTSTYELNVRMLSSKLSPLTSDDVEGSRISLVRIPKIWHALLNDRKVRVEGCGKYSMARVSAANRATLASLRRSSQQPGARREGTKLVEQRPLEHARIDDVKQRRALRRQDQRFAQGFGSDNSDL